MALRGYVIILTTVSSREDAERIARTIVSEKLAACVSIVDGVSSVYWWEGRVEEEKELLLIIKTSIDKLLELTRRLREIHPYRVPEILVLPVAAGLPDYLTWVEEATKR